METNDISNIIPGGESAQLRTLTQAEIESLGKFAVVKKNYTSVQIIPQVHNIPDEHTSAILNSGKTVLYGVEAEN